MIISMNLKWVRRVVGEFHHRLRPILILGLVAFILVEILLLTPSSLENEPAGKETRMLDPTVLVATLKQDSPRLAQGVPKDEIADYIIDDFDYISSREGQREWKVLAKKAFMYQKEQIVFAKDVIAHLFNPDGGITKITGIEAKFKLELKELEIFGDVKTVFPDGFQILSEYVTYEPEKDKIEIPDNYEVEGKGITEEGKEIDFFSFGLLFFRNDNVILLKKNVRFNFTTIGSQKDPNERQRTQIISDFARILRNEKKTDFGMEKERKIEDQFVRINQPDLFVRSREAVLYYGDTGEQLRSLVASQDVYIEETGGPPPTRYATCGRADFDNQKNDIVLTEFPQVYQGKDTVTGEVIIIHRDTDLVEVNYSNAFSQGNQDDPPRSKRPTPGP